MTLLYGQSVTVLRAPLIEDRYGNPVRDWTSATRTPVHGVAVQPSGTSEDQGQRSTVVSRWHLITRPGRDIDLEPADRIEYAGRTLEIEGEVRRFPGPGGGFHHVEVTLLEVNG
ncbi:head-tail adaptor protein [Streptomyces harbinensis]